MRHILSFAIILVGLSVAASSIAADTAPNWLRKPTPSELRAVWPRDALKRGLSGEVKIRCKVSVQGSVYACVVVSETPANAGFGAAALALTPQFRMTPASQGGKPVESEVTIPVRYAVTSADSSPILNHDGAVSNAEGLAFVVGGVFLAFAWRWASPKLGVPRDVARRLLIITVALLLMVGLVLNALGTALMDDAMRRARDGAGDGASKKSMILHRMGDVAYRQHLDPVAAWFYRPLAEAGDAEAQYDLGTMYFVGRGVPHDDAQAALWMRRAADQAFGPAQFELALMYAAGMGAPRDNVQALKWLSLAAADLPQSGQLYRMSLKARDNLAAKMTSDAVVDAQRQVGEWKPTIGVK